MAYYSFPEQCIIYRFLTSCLEYRQTFIVGLAQDHANPYSFTWCWDSLILAQDYANPHYFTWSPKYDGTGHAGKTVNGFNSVLETFNSKADRKKGI